jgi:CotH kinase protein/Secretion system C-terminal sorting domain
MKKAKLLVACFLIISIVNAQDLTSSNLPIIVINTGGQPIPDDPKITADMGIIYNGTGLRNNITDPFNQYTGKIGIEVRGQSSQMFPMKSYSIELRDDAGSSQDKSLFGLPKESDWVLYAPYNDKTLMHNFLAYTMAREMGHWSANCRYVEIVLNGDYIGIYVFMEKIKRNSGRVNVPKMSTTDIAGDAVTGGYLFSIDKDANAWFSAYSTNHSSGGQTIQYSYVYPKPEAIVTEQKNYIKSYVDSFENVLSEAQFQDKETGWRRFADEASFIDYFIVNEVSRNVDGYRLSAYFYKDRQSKGGKIIAGPVWDYDLAFRNANYCNGSNQDGWAYQFNTVCPQDYWQIPFWWDQFLGDTAFQSNLKCRWKQSRQNSLSTTHFNSLIDSIVNLTAEARQRHFQRWPVLGQYVWPNPDPIPGSYEEETSVLKNWLSARLSWIDGAVPNKGACFEYPANANASVIISFYPNPVQGQLFISVKSRVNQALQMQVHDAMGREIYVKSYPVTAGSNDFIIQSATWAPGVYFIHYNAASGEKATYKLVKG